jgi:threonine dehydratase
VLIGVQVPGDERAAFQSFLSDMGYDYVEESENPAYQLFLS